MLKEGMFLGDRYEILEKIGDGGMAEVYKAKCHKLNRLLAIKVLLEQPQFCLSALSLHVAGEQFAYVCLLVHH